MTRFLKAAGLYGVKKLSTPPAPVACGDPFNYTDTSSFLKLFVMGLVDCCRIRRISKYLYRSRFKTYFLIKVMKYNKRFKTIWSPTESIDIIL